MILLKPIAIKVAISIVGRDSETAAVVWRLVVAGVERDVASWGSLQYLNSSAGAWKVALYCCRVEVIIFLETLAIDVVECVEANSAVRSCKGQEREKSVEELHYAFVWC